MKLNLIVCDSDCSPCVFIINGVDAVSEDFGSQSDLDKGNKDGDGCGYMQFESKVATQEILSKYKITADQYGEIAKQLEDKLSFGKCGWCE